MSYVTISSEKLGSVTLPSKAFGHSRSTSVKTTKRHPLQHLFYVTLLAAMVTPSTVWAQAKPAPPIDGVIGKLQSFDGKSLDVQTPSGVVHVIVNQPLTTYKQIPSDLSHVAAAPYIGVASTDQGDGKQVAKQIFLFPTELRGAAEALYSANRSVPTYTRSQITTLKNNYNGATPDPGYISVWKLTLDGLASGLSTSLDIRNLLNRFSVHEQITRLVCVEGWSAIAWWAGLRFDDLLHAYPPMSQAKWARVESSVNLDASGNPDPYFMSLDLATLRHPQTLLATHFNGQPLTVDHGAPLRLLVPMKLGLKNVKAATRITFVAEEPSDYWAERGYSRYDGI